MTQPRKILDAVLSARRDQNIRFEDLRKLVRRLGFDERISGGHFIYTKPGIGEILNLQPRPDGTAKPYQVKQVRQIVTKYRLGVDDE